MIHASLVRLEEHNPEEEWRGSIQSGVIQASEVQFGRIDTESGHGREEGVRFDRLFTANAHSVALDNLTVNPDALRSAVIRNEEGISVSNVEPASFFRQEYLSEWSRETFELPKEKAEFHSYIVTAQEEQSGSLDANYNPVTGRMERGNVKTVYKYLIEKQALLEAFQRAYPESDISCLQSFFLSYGGTKQNLRVVKITSGSLIHSLLDFFPIEVKTTNRLTRRPFLSFESDFSVYFGETHLTFFMEGEKIASFTEYEQKVYGFNMVKKATGSPFYKIGNKQVFHREGIVQKPNF